MDPLLLATATGVSLIASAGYAASCAWWPFARCLRCEGRGKHSRSDGKVWRPCRRCKGSGKRLRIGRRLWNKARNVRDRSA